MLGAVFAASLLLVVYFSSLVVLGETRKSFGRTSGYFAFNLDFHIHRTKRTRKRLAITVAFALGKLDAFGEN